MSQCLNSPTGHHCYCTTSNGQPIGQPYWSVVPPALRCCWCGRLNTQEHGPFAPGGGGWPNGIRWRTGTGDPGWPVSPEPGTGYVSPPITTVTSGTTYMGAANADCLCPNCKEKKTKKRGK